MSDTTINKGTIGSFLKNPLGLIGLVTVVFESIAGLALTTGLKHLPMHCERWPIIWFIVLFPLIVLFVLRNLVVKHHYHLYSPKDYRDDGTFERLATKQITKNQEKEVTEYLKEGGQPKSKASKENANTLIMESEAIGLVAASEYFHTKLNKDVVLNSSGARRLTFDGMAFKGKTLCVAEIKLLPENRWRGIFERSLTQMQNNVSELSKLGYNVEALLVIVLKGHKTPEWEQKITEDFNSRKYSFELKIAAKSL